MSSPKIDIDIEKNKLKRIKNGKIIIEGTIRSSWIFSQRSQRVV